MSEYVLQEYPKWIGDVIVNNRAEERALTKAATKLDPVSVKVDEPVPPDADITANII